MQKRFAILGTGFWAPYQLAGWRELDGVECIAVYNRTKTRAEAFAARFGIPAVYDNPEALLERESLDFVDIITDVDTHRPFSELALARGVDAICQKPMAPTLADAEAMVAAARAAGRKLYIHENWRWQSQIRAAGRFLAAGRIGKPWRARVVYSNSFPVFDNQPFLKELDRFILMDVGTHIFDAVRFLFGEARTLYCHTHQVNKGIRGEDAATVMVEMVSGTTVSVELSYASRLEGEAFPQTFLCVEGEDASLELTRDYWIRITTSEGTWANRYPPRWYEWADSRYDVVHASIVDCNANLLAGMRGEGDAETSAEDNLETLRLVSLAYDSAEQGQVVAVGA